VIKISGAHERYKKLIVTWKKARPAPRTPEEAARLVVTTLKNHQKADVEVYIKDSNFQGA
jgi:hypothetical protein